MCYLFPDSRKNDKECQEESGEHDVEGDGGRVPNDGRPVAVGRRQVWSLTQFYSVSFLESRVSVQK